MTGEQKVLNTLTRQRLLELAEVRGLKGLTGGGKDEIISVLLPEMKKDFESLLGVLSRDELKEMCRVL